MKRKTVQAFLMSLCLAVSVPGTVCASEVQEQIQDTVQQDVKEQEPEQKEQASSDNGGSADKAEEKKEEQKKKSTAQSERSAEGNDTSDTLQYIESCVAEAVKEKHPDMASNVMKEFLLASDRYDDLSDTEKDGLSAECKKNLLTVRERIAETVHTAEGVTVDLPDWYAKTEVKESTIKDSVLKVVATQYAGSTPQLVYAKDISYTDVRDGKDYTQKSVVSFSFPVPEGYDKLKNPQIVRYADGQLVQMEPERKGDLFYVDMVYPLENIFVLDTPVALTGITLEKNVSVNAGQKQKLQVTTVPQNATQEYQLEWTSSNPKVATVDANGNVTALQAGYADITAKVKGTQLTAVCRVTVVQGAHALTTSVDTVLAQTRKYMQSVDKNPTLGSEWFVLGQARSGENTNGTYFKTYYNHIANYLTENKGKLTSSVKYTEYSKMILIMTSIGKDARNIAGYNLFEPLADFETVVGQGTNGPIWALIALNCNPAYEIPTVKGVKVQTTEQKLIDELLRRETKNGGWAMTGNTPDSDLTGMALQALAPYYHVKGYEKVTEAIDRALEVLSTMQNQSGGYSTMGVETSESAAQVLTGLCALGIDPMKDERFVKGGSWIVENLISYHISGSGFMHVKAGSGNNGGGVAGTVNGMATEQGYYALTAYQRLLQKKTALYDMSDIKLTKGDAGDGKGTGLEEQNKEDKKDTPKKDTGKKEDSKKDDNKDKKQTTKKKLTYKGKRLTLTAGSGKKTASGTATKLTLTGKAQDGEENSAGGWSFDPEAYTEEDTAGGDTGIALLQSDTAETAAVQTPETSADAADTQMEAGKARAAVGEVSRGHAVGLFFGGVAAGVLAAAGGVWLYLKKRKSEDK